MGEGYGCSNFQCSTLATENYIHTTVEGGMPFFFTSDKVHVHLTPQYSIDRSQRPVHNSWHALHVK